MIPPAHIVAETAAFPLATAQAFRLGPAYLDPALAGATGALWRAFEDERSGRSDGRSLDLQVAARDLAWFGRSALADSGLPLSDLETRRPVRLDRMLRHIVERVLDVRGPDATVRPATDDDRDLAHDPTASWRWLTLALPEDLLLVCASPARSPVTRVRVASPSLRRCIEDRGLAELHLHVGASARLRILWASALRALADFETSPDALASPGAVFRDGNDFAWWLLAGAIARQALGSFAAARSTIDIWSHVMSYPGLTTGDRLNLTQTLLDLLSPAATPTLGFAALQDLYRAMWPHPGPRSLPQCFAQIQELCDPLGTHFPAVGEITPEMRSLSALLARPSSEDELRLVWQVQRLRCLYFRHVTQQPMVSGLQWFVRWYGRISPLRRPIEDLLVECAVHADTGGGYAGLRSLEVRTSPAPDVSESRKTLGALLGSWKRARQLLVGRGPPWHPEFGIVLHFVKSRDAAASQWKTGRPLPGWRDTAADPAARGRGGAPVQDMRYQRYFGARRDEAYALRDLMQYEPEILWYLRGVDVCTDELGVPTWVIAPLFRFVRKAAEEARARLVGPGPLPEPFRATAHAGEDFVHLLGGLRRVHEAMHHLANHPGDRLGHAVALGTDPRAWAGAFGTVWQPLEERLLDLIFEYAVWTGSGRGRAPRGRLGWVERQLCELAHRLFGRSETLSTLVRGYSLLHTDLLTPDLTPTQVFGFPWGASRLTAAADAEQLVHDYLADTGVFERGHELLTIALDDAEVAALDAMSAFLREEAARRELLVEVNPSSNLLIGDLRVLRNHPIMSLDPPEEDFSSPRVRVGVGSDDPLTFSACLPEEYELLRAVAQARTDSERAESWIERIRQRSLDARFTLDPPASILQRVLGRLLGGGEEHPAHSEEQAM